MHVGQRVDRGLELVAGLTDVLLAGREAGRPGGGRRTTRPPATQSPATQPAGDDPMTMPSTKGLRSGRKRMRPSSPTADQHRPGSQRPDEGASAGSRPRLGRTRESHACLRSLRHLLDDRIPRDIARVIRTRMNPGPPRSDNVAVGRRAGPTVSGRTSPRWSDAGERSGCDAGRAGDLIAARRAGQTRAAARGASEPATIEETNRRWPPPKLSISAWPTDGRTASLPAPPIAPDGHSEWQPAADRPDPVALLEEQNTARNRTWSRCGTGG